MARWLYLASLCLLQASAIWHLVPAFASWLQRELPVGTVPPGGAAAVQLGAASLAIIGVTLTLGAPGLAAMRHWQRGTQRFPGLPDWGVAMTFTGATLFMVGVAARAAQTWLSGPADTLLAAMAPLIPAGTALMCGGVLAAELLRRSVPPHRARRVNLRIAVDVSTLSADAATGATIQPAVILSRAA